MIVSFTKTFTNLRVYFMIILFMPLKMSSIINNEKKGFKVTVDKVLFESGEKVYKKFCLFIPKNVSRIELKMISTNTKLNFKRH